MTGAGSRLNSLQTEIQLSVPSPGALPCHQDGGSLVSSLPLQQYGPLDKGPGDALLSTCCMLRVHFATSFRFVLIRNVHGRMYCPPFLEVLKSQ